MVDPHRPWPSFTIPTMAIPTVPAPKRKPSVAVKLFAAVFMTVAGVFGGAVLALLFGLLYKAVLWAWH